MKPREPRRKVLIEARLRQDCGWGDARILNISRQGLLMRSPATPPRGAYVEICRGTHRIVARVVWVGEDRFGVRAQDAIAIDAVLTGEEAALPQPANDRRTAPRGRSPAERHHQSRRWSRRLEFAAIALFAGTAALVAFDAAFESLARPLGLIETTLSASR